MAPNAHRHPTAWRWSLGSLAVGITLLLAGCGGSHSSAADGGYDQDFNIKVPADALDFSAVKG